MAKRKFDESQELEICRRYNAGENSRELAEAFQAGETSIFRALERNGIKRRSIKEARGGLSEAQELEICLRYKAGESTLQLSRAFGPNDSVIGKILTRRNIKRRPPGFARRKFSSEQELEMARLYESGKNTNEIGKTFDVSGERVRRILIRNKIEIRNLSLAHGGLTESQKEVACLEYIEGKSLWQLGRDFGVSGGTVKEAIASKGVVIRTRDEVLRALTDEQELEVCQLYQIGKNAKEISQIFEVSPNTIGNILDRHSIEKRLPRDGTDSVQDALDCSGNHDRVRECEFYAYELARYADTHCKPGIAFNPERRAANSNGEYGSEILSLFFSTRQEAFFLEQALLELTKDKKQIPDDLVDWIGASEIRAISAVEMVDLATKLQQEMEELGVWGFAAQYVPMTTAQRDECLRRT